MQPALGFVMGVAVTLAPAAAVAPAVAPVTPAPVTALGWMLLLVIAGTTMVLTWLVRRAALAPALQHWVRWLNPLVVLLWLGVAALLTTLLLRAETLAQTAGRIALLVVLGVVTAPLLRDLLSGVVVSFEGRYRLGDDIRVAELEGRIVALGLRSVVLRAHDGSEYTIPNGRFVAADVVRLNLPSGEAPFELEVVLHRDGGLEAATNELVEAALLSPLAAPGSLPEVFVVEADGSRLRLRMRVYVFDRIYEERYRSDILTRLASTTRGVLVHPAGDPALARDALDPHG
jgi:small-conductance mechanosensitive channel